MKRWLLFLALFAVGVLVVWRLDQSRRRPPQPDTTSPPADGSRPQGESTLTPLDIGDGKTVSADSSGSFVSSAFDEKTGKVLYRIRASNHQSLGDGVYRFENLVARFFQQVEGDREVVEFEIVARQARGRMATAPALDFDRAFPVELEGVVATQHLGSPFAPLRLEVPRATGSFAEGRFRSDDAVVITGRGLKATGIGVTCDSLAGVLELLRETQVTLEMEDGSTAKLSTPGGLTFTDLREGVEGATRVASTARGHLTFDGERPLIVDADALSLDAIVVREPQSRVQPTAIRASGSVVLQPKEGKFFGDSAALELDARGRPRSADLIGAPRVELFLRDIDTRQLPLSVESDPSGLPVELDGAGPLHVELEGEPHFEIAGPASLRLPTLELSLTASQRLTGTRRGESEFGSLTAVGEVVARSVSSTLTAPELTLERREDASGKATAVLTTTGATRAYGDLADGGSFDLTAGGGLEYVRLENSFQVPLARDVDLRVEGSNAMHARARVVRDLDEVKRSFVGDGEVRFVNRQGRGTAERVTVFGPDSAELIGAPSKPARVEFDQGWLEARTLTIQPADLRAEGEARSSVGLDGANYDIDARWISVGRVANEAGFDLKLAGGGDVDLTVRDGEQRLKLAAQFVEARAFSPDERLERVEPRGLDASGRVHFTFEGEQALEGQGEHLAIDGDGVGTLLPAEGRRVSLSGRLPKDELRFRMDSGSVRFSPEHLSADDADVEIEGFEVPMGRASAATAKAPLRAIAGTMSVDPESILFTDGVYLGQSEEANAPWSLDAEKLVMTGSRVRVEGEAEPRFVVARMMAWGGFHAEFAEELEARGETLLLDREDGRMSVRGEPAVLERGQMLWSSSWLEVDLSTGYLRSSPGSLRSVEDDRGDFVMEYASLQPAIGTDSRIQVVREPVIRDVRNQREIRASWGLFWVDEQLLQRTTADLLGRDAPEEPPSVPAPKLKKPAQFFADLERSEIAKWVREAYLEGNFEVIERGVRRVRAEALYLDLVDGHGWVRDIDITMDMPFRSRLKHLKLHADWMRYSRDGSARAKKAVATSCEFDEPHYEIMLGDLRMKPKPSDRAIADQEEGRTEHADETDGYAVESKNNGVRIGRDSPLVPIPRVSFPTTANFRVPADSLSVLGIRPFSLGSNAKFGTFIGISFDLPLGWLSKQAHRLLRATAEPPQGKNNTDVQYLNSRGLLLGFKNTLWQDDAYKVVTRLDFINDTGRDRGLLRVPKGDRDSFRAWLRVEGRRLLGDGEWIDFNLTTQTDAGVQAEFFEGDFQRWEERETYVHWRQARGLDYWRATAEIQLDTHRTEVMEQPSAGYTRARGPLARLFGRDLVYVSNHEVARLKRLEGDPQFEGPFLDGFGEREVLRADTTQRVELPMPLRVLGARLVPFVEARGTLWDRGGADRSVASRLGAIAGAELSTSFWRLFGDGDVHSLTPTIGFRGDLAVEEDGPQPAAFDGIEDPLDGRVAELGLRSRWVKPRDPRQPELEQRFLDIEVRQAFAEGLSGGRAEGWQPLRVNAQWLSEFAGVPFGVTHDGRYDLESGDTVYSRSFLGVRPVDDIEIETGFHNARDLNGTRLYSAWSVAARYDFSEKWQIEARETISSLSGNQLNSGVLLRRMGHDFVVELEYSFTAGEGGSSISFNLIPMLTYRQPRLGLLQRWQEQGN